MAQVHRLHPDADAGLSQLLMVIAAVSAIKVGQSAVLQMGAAGGPLLIDGPKLLRQLRLATMPQIERALRPLYNEVLISAYAALQSKHGIIARDDRPEVEFLRHARNASAHGNVFTLRRGEPVKPATWREKEITQQLSGQVLLYRFLKPGDVLQLVDDVFQVVDPQP